MHHECRSRLSKVQVHVRSDWVSRCLVETGSSHRWDLMLVWSHLVSMMRDPCRAGIVRAVAWRDDANCSVVTCEYWPIVLQVDSGIVTIPLFKIDVPLSS